MWHFLNGDYPVFGASPDAIAEDMCIEIKCPSKESSIKNYVTKNNKLTETFYAQVQMQMYFTNLQKTLFCVASPKFEENKNINVIPVEYDKEYCLAILKEAFTFWEYAIFPIICGK